MKTNLRHLRVYLAAHDGGSVTRAAEAMRLSQPAVSQALGKLERLAGQPLFLRRGGLFPTAAGEALALRLRRAFGLLDPALSDIAPRLVLTATSAQLQALVATCEAENFTLAARRMGMTQPSVHRAVSQLEQEAGQKLFARTAFGLMPTRVAERLAMAARLAFAELDQAEADLAELAGREVGAIVIGAMPLSRSFLLPRVLARFRQVRPTLPVRVLDGPYADLVSGLRRGEIDILIGALRDTPPAEDVIQKPLFQDDLMIVARPGHPVLENPASLACYPFVVGLAGTPGRQAFDRLMAGFGTPPSLIETGSMILMREILAITNHLGCISRLQIAAEIRLGAVVPVPVPMQGTSRIIGLTMRSDWLPTRAQSAFLDAIEAELPGS